MDIDLNSLVPSVRDMYLAEGYRKDYKFYLRCRRVLYKRGAKKKLIAKVNRELEYSKSRYEFYMHSPNIIATNNYYF